MLLMPCKPSKAMVLEFRLPCVCINDMMREERYTSRSESIFEDIVCP